MSDVSLPRRFSSILAIVAMAAVQGGCENAEPPKTAQEPGPPRAGYAAPAGAPAFAAGELAAQAKSAAPAGGVNRPGHGFSGMGNMGIAHEAKKTELSSGLWSRELPLKQKSEGPTPATSYALRASRSPISGSPESSS